MQRCKQRHVRSDKHVFANGDGANVKHGKVEVGVTALAKRGVCAEVEVDRTLQVHALGAVGQQLVEYLFAFGFVELICLVVLQAQLVRTGTRVYHIRVKSVVHFAVKHFFRFGHAFSFVGGGVCSTAHAL